MLRTFFLFLLMLAQSQLAAASEQTVGNIHWAKKPCAAVYLRTAQYREYVSRWQATGMTEQQYWQAFDAAVQAAHTTGVEAQ